MTRTLPKVPLWPRAGRSGRSAVAALSSMAGGPDAAPASCVPWASCRPKPRGRFSGIRVLGRRRLAGLVGQRSEPLHPGEEALLAVVEPLLDVEREDVPPAGRADAERDRDG